MATMPESQSPRRPEQPRLTVIQGGKNTSDSEYAHHSVQELKALLKDNTISPTEYRTLAEAQYKKIEQRGIREQKHEKALAKGWKLAEENDRLQHTLDNMTTGTNMEQLLARERQAAKNMTQEEMKAHAEHAHQEELKKIQKQRDTVLIQPDTNYAKDLRERLRLVETQMLELTQEQEKATKHATKKSFWGKVKGLFSRTSQEDEVSLSARQRRIDTLRATANTLRTELNFKPIATTKDTPTSVENTANVQVVYGGGNGTYGKNGKTTNATPNSSPKGSRPLGENVAQFVEPTEAELANMRRNPDGFAKSIADEMDKIEHKKAA